MKTLMDVADGRWPEILGAIAGVSRDQLTDKHQPCPACGGEDRFRWDSDEGRGSWYCNQCGGKSRNGGAGNGLDLLVRIKGWDFRQAAAAVEEYLGIRKPEPRATYQWKYANREEKHVITVHRTDNEDGSKKIWQKAAIQGKRPKDLIGQALPLYWREAQRELENGAPYVYWVEGEKCADVLWMLGLPAVTSIGGAGKFRADRDGGLFPPERVVVVPDRDAAGVAHMRQVAAAYSGCRWLLCYPDEPARWEAQLPKAHGVDIADWIEDGVEVEGIVAAIGGEGPPEERVVAEPELPADPFVCLGFSGNDFFYQPGDSGQVMSLTAGNGHSALNLIRLAPKAYWEREYPRYNADGERIGVDWQSAVDTLTREQYRIGAYDANRIRGIGAWIDNGTVVFHLGDRLIWGDESIPVLKQPKGHYLYQRLPRKKGPGTVQPMSDDEGLGLAMLADRFSWQAPASGRLLAGWVALAPIAGALDWRPHVWVSGVAGTGKTTVVTEYVMPLLADMALFALGNTTEAGLRQTLRSDAVPVVFDEAESNSPEDAKRIQAVLTLARSASAQTGAHNYKGTARGEAQMYEIRSMFLLSSITTGLVQGADRTRFSNLVLQQGLQGEDWAALESDIAALCSRAAGQRLIARMVRLAPLVREVAEQMRVVVARHLRGGSRTGQQVGALLAGWWCLMNQRPPTEEEAAAMVTGTCWREHGGDGDEKGGDQGELLATLLEARLIVEVGGVKYSRTVLELCRIVAGVADEDERVARAVGGERVAISKKDASDELGRNGIAVRDDGRLHIANQSKGIERILAASKWSRGEWKTLLAAIPGAQREESRRFPCLATTRRAVSLPASVLLADEA